MKNLLRLLATSLVIFGTINCTSSTEPGDGNGSGGEAPAVFNLFSDAVNIYTDGDFVVLESNGIPDHNSPYFNAGDARYEAYNGSNSNFHLNPNRIATQDIVMRIPLNPAEASSHSSTQLGPIGMSINGIPIYNQYAGPNQPLTNEIDSFDQYNGHPQRTGQYHYHVEPTWLTAQNGKSSLIGFLLDGFPVYGPEENGAAVLNSDLDQYHGHSHATAEYPDGIYHYHITASDPYINGGQYFGTPGNVSQ